MGSLTNEDLGAAIASGRLTISVTDRGKQGFDDWATIQKALSWAMARLPRRCSICGGEGSVVMSSSNPPYEPARRTCTACDGTGVAPPPMYSITINCPHDAEVGPFSCRRHWVCPPDLGLHRHKDDTCEDQCDGGVRMLLRPSVLLCRTCGVPHGPDGCADPAFVQLYELVDDA